MTKYYYYAVDSDGQGWYYDNPPVRVNGNWEINHSYDCLDSANDLHDASHFSFEIPVMTYEDDYLTFSVEM